jgi:hypothetical protein
MTTPSAALQEEIGRIVHEVAKKFAPDVQWIRYSIDSDWSGDQAIFFRIMLSDEAARRSRIRPLTRRVEAALAEQVDPVAHDYLFYYNYRSRSEQARIKEPAWSKG